MQKVRVLLQSRGNLTTIYLGFLTVQSGVARFVTTSTPAKAVHNERIMRASDRLTVQAAKGRDLHWMHCSFELKLTTGYLDGSVNIYVLYSTLMVVKKHPQPKISLITLQANELTTRSEEIWSLKGVLFAVTPISSNDLRM